jgi:hypothetical protein
LLLRKRQRRLLLLDFGLARADLRLLDRDLRVNVLNIGLRLLHRCLGQIDRNPVVGRLDLQQQIAFVYELIVNHRQLDDAACDLRRHSHDVGSHGAIACPWSTHIGLPHCPAQHGRKPGGGKRDQKRDNPDPGVA